MGRDTFSFRNYVCPDGHEYREASWASEPTPVCPTCRQTGEINYRHSNHGRSPAMIGDEIDIWVKNGICNDDGSPKRYRSKSEIRAAAAARGLVIYGETPK